MSASFRQLGSLGVSPHQTRSPSPGPQRFPSSRHRALTILQAPVILSPAGRPCNRPATVACSRHGFSGVLKTNGVTSATQASAPPLPEGLESAAQIPPTPGRGRAGCWWAAGVPSLGGKRPPVYRTSPRFCRKALHSTPEKVRPRRDGIWFPNALA